MNIIPAKDDRRVKVSADDLPGFLADKMAAGTGITLTQVSDGSGGEAVEVSTTGGTGIPELEPTEASGATSALVGKYYVANNISQVVFTLPATAVFGDKIGFLGKGAGGWKIQCNAGQTIHSAQGNAVSGGYVKSGEFRSGIVIMCITADTDWKIIWSDGNFILEV